MPEDRFPDVLGAADVLLVSERPSVRDMSLPSKLTSYFAAGRPVVALTRTDGATAAELRRTGAGLVVPAGEGGALLHTLRWLREQPREAERLAEAGSRYAREHLAAEAALARAERFVLSLSGRELSSADRIHAQAREMAEAAS